jgi:hypothetical protein
MTIPRLLRSRAQPAAPGSHPVQPPVPHVYCPESKVQIKNRPVILSEAYFSGAEGPLFVRFVSGDSAFEKCNELQIPHAQNPGTDCGWPAFAPKLRIEGF